MRSMTVDLTEEQIDLIISVLIERVHDLDIIMKNGDGLSDETLHDLRIEHRDVNNIMRELQHYSTSKPLSDAKA